MRKIIITLFAIFTLANVSSARDFLKEKSFFSTSLNKDMNYYVSLPDDYDPNNPSKKYPVIIFLHSASVTPTDFATLIEGLYNSFVWRWSLNNFFKTIFVIADGTSSPYRGSFYTNSSLYGNYEDYISKDLTKEIIDKYHTTLERSKWSIMGHSMGAYGAAKIGFKHPEDYAGVATLSAPLHITYQDEMIPIVLSENGNPPYNYTYSGDVTKLIFTMAGAFSPDPGNDPPVLFPLDEKGEIIPEVIDLWEPHNPINLVKDWNQNPSLGLYMYCGKNDEYKLYTHHKMFKDTCDKYNIPYKFEDNNGDHINGIITYFPKAVDFLYHVMDTTQTQTMHIYEDKMICAGDSYNGRTETGVYDRKLKKSNGFDSIVTTTLTVRETIEETHEEITINEGDDYFGFTTAGEHTRTLESYFGCDSVVITQLTINHRPVAKAGAINALCPNETGTLSATLSSDPDNDALTYQWESTGLSLSSTTGESVAFTAPDIINAQTYTVGLTVNDGRMNSDAVQLLITVNSKPEKPVIVANSASEFCEGGQVTLSTNNNFSEYLWSTNESTANITVQASSIITLVVKNDKGCSSETSNEISVAVKPLPDTPSITQNGDLLTSSFTANNQWFLEGVEIEGANAHQYTITKSGNYSVQAISENGCNSESSEALFVVFSTVEEFSSEIEIYPNPTNGLVQLRGLTNNANTSIQVFNSNGQLVMQDVATSAVHQLNLTALTSGVYLIKIEHSDIIEIIKK